MKKATAFRLDDNVLSELKIIAEREDRSINWLVNNTLKNFIEGDKILLSNYQAVARIMKNNC
jgi:predicted transcriptional regulator